MFNGKSKKQICNYLSEVLEENLIPMRIDIKKSSKYEYLSAVSINSYDESKSYVTEDNTETLYFVLYTYAGRRRIEALVTVYDDDELGVSFEKPEHFHLGRNAGDKLCKKLLHKITN